MPRDRTNRNRTRDLRRRNREDFIGVLDRNGVEYTDLNNGAHLRIKGGFDVFPSRGAWRGPNGKGSGVYSLIAALGVDPHAPTGRRIGPGPGYHDPTPAYWKGRRP